jgi:hypothetical protein
MPSPKNSKHHPQSHTRVPAPRISQSSNPLAGRQLANAFQEAHLRLFGTPSGTATFQITVSENPQDWSYQAVQTSRLQQGPKTPREIIDPNCPPQYKNQIFLTDIHVTACISKHWNKPPLHDKSLIGGALSLGCVSNTPPPPAELAWLVAAVEIPISGKSYTGNFKVLYLLSLGSHYAYSEFFDQAPHNLIANIKATAAARLHGPKPVTPTDWASGILGIRVT